MSAYTEEEDLTDEQLLRKNLSVVPTQTINRVDEDTQFRREQKRKKELAAYQQQQKLQYARLEAQQKRQIEIDKLNNEMELRGHGWSHWPQPHEKFYHEGACDLCNSPVMILDENSPHVTVHDFPKNMPREKIQNGYNYEIKHVCKEITTQYVQRLWDVIADLNQRLAVHDERASHVRYMPVG